jgi:hypothetical protein
MGPSNDLSLRRLCAAAIVVLTACGGGSGAVENVLDAMSAEAASGADASIMEGGTAVDGQGDAGLSDRTVQSQDTGVPSFDSGPSDSAQSGDGGSQDADASSSPGLGSPPPGSTTYSIFAAHSPKDGAATCLGLVDGGGPDLTSCLAANGCLDPATGGGLCELLDAAVPGSKELGDPRQNCLQTLYDTLTSGCAVTLQLTPCLCGDADPTLCIAGDATPNGPVYPDYVKSFGVTSGADINTTFAVPTYGAGMANQLLTCGTAFNCDCFAAGR